jgi:hypothetical protein
VSIHERYGTQWRCGLWTDGSPTSHKPVEFESATDLFCLDLFNEFDIDRLALVAEPALP